MQLNNCVKARKKGSSWQRVSPIIRSRFDARSPLMTHIMSAEIFRLSGAAFRLAPPIGRLVVVVIVVGVVVVSSTE